MAQLVKILHEDLNLIPRNHVKKQGVRVSTCKWSIEKGKTDRSLWLTGQPVSPNQQSPSHWEILSQKARWILPEEWHPQSPHKHTHRSTHTCTHACTPAHTHSYIHTPENEKSKLGASHNLRLWIWCLLIHWTHQAMFFLDLSYIPEIPELWSSYPQSLFTFIISKGQFKDSCLPFANF